MRSPIRCKKCGRYHEWDLSNAGFVLLLIILSAAFVGPVFILIWGSIDFIGMQPATHQSFV